MTELSSNVPNDCGEFDNPIYPILTLLSEAGAFKRGDYTFASGVHATLKVDVSVLYNPENIHLLECLIMMFVKHPVIQEADALTYVPDGMRTFMELVAARTNKPIIHIVKASSGKRYSFAFATPVDEQLARSVHSIAIGEDVITTGGSVNAVRILFGNAIVSAVSVLERGAIHPQYKKGTRYYTLSRKKIPLHYEDVHFS